MVSGTCTFRPSRGVEARCGDQGLTGIDRASAQRHDLKEEVIGGVASSLVFLD
jgi:hypothetical protein